MPLVTLMADVKWIKLSTGLPDNRKIKQIRKLPDGDTIALMWIFLMCLAGETNDDGMVYFTSEIPYTDEMLAEQFSMEVNTVRLGIQTFQRFGMLDIVDNIICLSAWEKWQSVDKMAEIREYNRLAKQKSRAKQKLLASVNDMSMTSQPSQDTDIDKDIDKEKEEDKEIYNTIVSYLNEKAGKSFRSSSKKTRSCIHARLEEGFTLDDFKMVIDNKCADWLGDRKMDEYLRPETLFGTKFESYLNAKIRKGGNNGCTGRTDDQDFCETVGTWL